MYALKFIASQMSRKIININLLTFLLLLNANWQAIIDDSLFG